MPIFENRTTRPALKEVTQPNDAFSKIAWVVFSSVAVFSLAKPNPHLMAIVFLAAYYILIWRKDVQKTAVCFCVVAYMALNALFVVHGSPELFSDSRLYIANRLWYAVGIAIFAKHLIDEYIAKEKHVVRAIFLGFVCLFGAYMFYVHDRTEKMEPKEIKCMKMVGDTCITEGEIKAWYPVDTLADDVLVGLTLCFLIAATEASGVNRKRDEVAAPETDESHAS